MKNLVFVLFSLLVLVGCNKPSDNPQPASTSQNSGGGNNGGGGGGTDPDPVTIPIPTLRVDSISDLSIYLKLIRNTNEVGVIPKYSVNGGTIQNGSFSGNVVVSINSSVSTYEIKAFNEKNGLRSDTVTITVNISSGGGSSVNMQPFFDFFDFDYTKCKFEGVGFQSGNNAFDVSFTFENGKFYCAYGSQGKKSEVKNIVYIDEVNNNIPMKGYRVGLVDFQNLAFVVRNDDFTKLYATTSDNETDSRTKSCTP
jgi:hypothetical protein